MGVRSAVQIFQALRALKHLSVSPFVVGILMESSLSDISFLKGSAGDVHMPIDFYKALNAISPIENNGAPISNGCVIVEMQKLIDFVETL